MKILLSGGAGFIGSHTCTALIEGGHIPVIVDNFSNSSPDIPYRIEKITGKLPACYELDIADKERLYQVFKKERPDAVIHFAGFKAVGESVERPLKYYRNNLDTTLSLLEVMAETNVNSFIFSSSATVYGMPEKVPITEDMKTSCTNPYGRTKLIIEDILRDVCAANKNLCALLLRYFNPIGAHKSGLIGENPKGVPNNLMPYITQVAAGKLPVVNVFGADYPTKDGTGVRDYIHVIDLALGHVAAVEYAAKQKEAKGAEVFNLGTGKGYSVLDIIRTFEKANSLKIPFEVKARRKGDVAEVYADVSKAREKLGWYAKEDLEAMCRDAWEWQKKL